MFACPSRLINRARRRSCWVVALLLSHCSRQMHCALDALLVFWRWQPASGHPHITAISPALAIMAGNKSCDHALTRMCRDAARVRASAHFRSRAHVHPHLCPCPLVSPPSCAAGQACGDALPHTIKRRPSGLAGPAGVQPQLWGGWCVRVCSQMFRLCV